MGIERPKLIHQKQERRACQSLHERNRLKWVYNQQFQISEDLSILNQGYQESQKILIRKFS